MKKFFKVMLISICSLVAIVGCTQKEVDNSQKVENSDETIKVMEDVYVDYINDIYLDSSKYIGKTIEIEGLFTVEKDKNDKEHFYVYRWSDMEVDSNDYEEHEDNHSHEENEIVEGKCGLELSYDKKLPKKDDWIKVIGKLKNKNNNLIIEAETVEIMNEKGLEKVKSFY